MTREELKEKAADLPLAPGVYLMMDKMGKVIYVGKAKKLKNRVSQYFQDSASHTVKTRQMVSQIDHFDTIFVSSEFEALVLENSLIKRHMPRYNILLKDDKGYPFVRLSRETYPRFTMVSRYANDSARYFGPFWRTVRDPAGPGRSASPPCACPPAAGNFPGYRHRAAMPQFPYGPVRRLLPPGDERRGVQPPHPAGGAAAGGQEQAAPAGDDRRNGSGGGGAAL